VTFDLLRVIFFSLHMKKRKTGLLYMITLFRRFYSVSLLCSFSPRSYSVLMIFKVV